MRRATAAAALVLLAAIAGCSLPGDGQESPTATATLSAETAPPGVSAESGRLANASALLDAHEAALLETGFSYELRTNATVRRRNGTRQIRRQQVTRVAPGRETYAYTTVNPGSRFDVWGNETMQAVKVQYGGAVEYRRGNASKTSSLTGRALLSRYLASGEWTVADVATRDGRTLVSLTSDTRPDDAAAVPKNATDVRNYRSSVIVDSRGRVVSFEASATYTLGGEDGSFSIDFRLQSTEAPGVQRPAWVANATT